MSRKKQIEETLHCLIGHPLWGAGRVANLLSFQFGPGRWRTNLRGQASEVRTYALHVQCAWHLAKAHRLIAASGDLSFPPGEESKNANPLERDPYQWPKKERTLLDEQLCHFFLQYEKMPVVVQGLQANDLGGLNITLSDDHILTIFPDTSSDDEEYWRFFQPATDLPHFVVTAQGIERQEEE
ncbi:MAG TPA: hypothetical protein VFN35_24490 [Ktedonobacteraceae bacterium]|nr:hypothetical protein [Ktedonobacteraceae bacterium]